MTLENINEICVAIDIAILGIAYPIIVDKISTIGDKYSSEYLSEVFSREVPHNRILRTKYFSLTLFQLTLYLTILSFVFLIFPFPPLFGWDKWFINHSAKLLVFLLTGCTTSLFFIWLNKVALYNGKSTTLLKRLLQQYPLLENDSTAQDYQLKAINEITLYAVAKQDEHLEKELLKFYGQVFSDIRRNAPKNKPLEYPNELYLLIYKLNYELAEGQNRKLLSIQHRAVSGVWLLGEFQDVQLSEITYTWLWRNLYSICDNDRYVRLFWANSYQYFDYRLPRIPAQYDQAEVQRTGQVIASNQAAIEKRNTERNRFLALHYALGGLLLYRKRYDTLVYILNYSQSIPARYPLLPKNMTDVFYWIEYFRNDFKSEHGPVDSLYYFPELDNFGNSDQIRFWICSYVTLLFLRQYSLAPHLVTQRFTDLPTLPNDIVELENWLETTSYFNNCLAYLLSHENILKDVRLWKSVEEHSSDIKSFAARLKTAILEEKQRRKFTATISERKVEQFEQQSAAILSTAFQDYKAVVKLVDTAPEVYDLKIPIRGGSVLMSKSAFTENDIPTMNFDTIFAEHIAADKIRFGLQRGFNNAATSRYLLNAKNLLAGLEKLIGQHEDIFIIGVHLDYDVESQLQESRLNNFLIKLSAPGHLRALFILKHTDLPSLLFSPLPPKEVEDYRVRLIQSTFPLYASVIDINLPENLAFRERWSAERIGEETDLKVEIALIFLADLYWQKERKVIQVNIASRFKEEGIQNDLGDLEPL
ncbi:MAG: hypothetical protein E6Q24_07255 [Chitinophagaceae bacterium]|nr:MAG: hypothetical protein E6Q24_07255 [Chitinophagaceae bacterium]